MTLKEFIQNKKNLVMSLSVEQYQKIRPILQEFYSGRYLAYIDDYCRFLPQTERFLLCNIAKKQEIITPMMYLNAITFTDRVSFEKLTDERRMDMNLTHKLLI